MNRTHKCLLGIVALLTMIATAAPANAQNCCQPCQGGVQASNLSGQWSGYWHSDANGHRGRIGATFEQVGSNQVQARFRGTFAKIIPFRYRTNLDVTYQDPGLTILSGSKRLPISGRFRYYAEISNGEFTGTFSSPRNRGTWVMQR